MPNNDAAMGTEVAVPAKRRQILSGARQVFGELGFERASVDLIAARAGVSKATVYNHYADKKALFVAAVLQDCEEMTESLKGCLEKPPADLEQGLRIIGHKVMQASLSPAVSGLYRQAIAEVGRLPEIGRMVFERGTLVMRRAVASHLGRWAEAGALRLDDPESAAIVFVALCQGDLAVRSRLGLLEYPVDDEVRASVERAVQVFVRAYRA